MDRSDLRRADPAVLGPMENVGDVPVDLRGADRAGLLLGEAAHAAWVIRYSEPLDTR